MKRTGIPSTCLTALLAVLPIGLGSAGCSENGSDSSGARVQASWWKGNLHTHSLWSDGDDYPEMIVGWYREEGYHFLALSDHNTLAEGERWISVAAPDDPMLTRYRARFGADWVEERPVADGLEVRLKTLEEYRPLFEEPGHFLMFQAEEISDEFDGAPIHVIASNIDAHIPPQGGNSVVDVMQRNVDAILAQRATTGRMTLPHIAHPNFEWAVSIDDLLALRRDDFFEIYNGHPRTNDEGDETRPGTERMWDLLITDRIERGAAPMYGLAVDDSHDYAVVGTETRSPGRGWVMVRSTELTTDAIVSALEAGDFYASTGVELDDVEARAGELRISIAAEAGVAYTTTFLGTRGNQTAGRFDGGTLEIQSGRSGPIGSVLAVVEGTSPIYTPVGDELYVRAKIVSSRPMENPQEAGELETAWTQPVTLR